MKEQSYRVLHGIIGKRRKFEITMKNGLRNV